MLCRLAAAFLCLAASALEPATASVRIKDIAALQGVRDNQIVGYGLGGLRAFENSNRSNSRTN